MTGILAQLSLPAGERTQAANVAVMEQCLKDPALLAEIAAGLSSTDAALAGDCAEVMTLAAEQRPDFVAPYAPALAGLLHHKTTRVRWEAAHALAYIAGLAPSTIQALLPGLANILRTDKSIIVRDYTVDMVGNYAASSSQAAREAYPLLKEALEVWNRKHAGHALNGLANVARVEPSLQAEIRQAGQKFYDESKGVVKKAAKALLG